MKKEYEAPDMYIEEYELENSGGNLCMDISGVGGIEIESIKIGFPWVKF